MYMYNSTPGLEKLWAYSKAPESTQGCFSGYPVATSSRLNRTTTDNMKLSSSDAEPFDRYD